MKMKQLSLAAACAAASMTLTTARAGGADDPVLTLVKIDQFEIREQENGDNPLVVEAEGWIGKDLHKFWWKADVEKADGELEEAEFQALYSRAVSPYWDLQVGWRHDARPTPDRDWLALGVKGLAPYFFEVDAALFVGDEGQVNARVSAEYELMLTQRWVLSPELSVNLYADDEPEREIGSGLADMGLGLRLRYEIRREFAPYVGLQWSKKFGDTADYARANGEKDEDLQWVVGFSAWF